MSGGEPLGVTRKPLKGGRRLGLLFDLLRQLLPLPPFAPFSFGVSFNVGAGWTLTEELEMRREIAGPAADTSYRTTPARVVPFDRLLRWGLLVVALLDENAD